MSETGRKCNRDSGKNIKRLIKKIKNQTLLESDFFIIFQY